MDLSNTLRDRIFREIHANVLVHREFANPYPAKMLIGENSVATENWNKPHGNGLINPNLFSPFPKNPVIARFFKEIGLVEELGSGIRNTFKYVKLYSNGKNPEFEEGDLFRCTIPLDSHQHSVTKTGNQVGNQDNNQDSNQDGDPFNKFKGTQNLVKSPDTLLKALEGIWFEIKEGYAFSDEQLEVVKPYLIYKNEYWQTILETCLYPRSKKDIFKAIGVTAQTKNFNAIIAPLIMHRMLELTIKDRPTSKFQKYLITNNGKKMLQLLKDESSQKK